MINLRNLAFPFICLMVLASCLTQKASHRQSPDWRPLLTDSGLLQWQQLGGKAPYRIDSDNIVVGTTIDTDKNSFLATREIFTDFIFEVDVNVNAGMNSGVQFRSSSLDSYKNGRVHGYQMEIDTSSRKWSGGIYDEGRSGWLYNLSQNRQCQDQFKTDEWNIYRIEAIGNSLRTFINSVPCANMVDEASPSGFIALQIHSANGEAVGKQAKWRNPRIITENLEKFATPIQTTPKQFSYLKNRLTDMEKSVGWQLLWPVNGEKVELPTSWKVQQHQILAKTEKSQPTAIKYPVPYQNFEFEADIKIGDQLEGGVRYLLSNDLSQTLEFQLSDDELNPQTKDPKKSLAAIFDKVAPVNQSEPERKSKRVKGKQGWNRVRIVVEHGKATHWMNNIKLAQITLSSEQKLPNSQLSIELERGSMQLRNLKLREIRSNPGDREGHVMTEVVPRDIIPPAPILNIKDALASFKLHPEFDLEVVAKEPLIYDPVVALYDQAGRLWALEMTTYMPDTQADGEFKHESQIVVLTDTNQDGEMDKRQVVIEKILLPRALAFVQGGIIWADHETLYFSELEENDGEITVIKTEAIDPSYAAGGNIEHKPNGLLFSLDNWYYSAKSQTRYRPYPLNQALPKDATEIYRNRFWKMATSQTEYRGQWGLSQDDYGRHYFNDNYTPLQTTSFIPNAAIGNPQYKFPKELLAQNVGTRDVYPIRVTPGINRGYQKNMYTEDFKLNAHTAACGPLIYRGNQFPTKYYGIGLVQEPAGNLVKATKIMDKKGVVSGKNLFEQQEILASTDERFRPVNAINAPDGTVTIIDFYHGILQHRTFLTSYLAEQIKMRDLERSKHIGRLYRLRHKSSPIPKVENLDNLSAIDLVTYLGHDNGWYRDMAQQLLVMTQGKEAIQHLKEVATTHSNHLAQIKALWTLEGLGTVDFNLLKLAANTQNDKVKRSVYRLVTLLPKLVKEQKQAEIDSWLNTQATQASKEVANSLLLAIADLEAWPVLTKLIHRFGVNDFTHSALGSKGARYLAAQGKKINADWIAEITSVINETNEIKSNRTLEGESLASYNRGSHLYNGEAGCFGCHGADGEGNQTIPPLNKSEWVLRSKERLTAILLKGLTGPITVNNKAFDTSIVMPGLGQNHNFSNQDLADIANYIRNAWTNQADILDVKDVKEVRQRIKQQKLPYSVQTLNAQFQ